MRIQYLQISNQLKEFKRPIWRKLFFIVIAIGALAITAAWILSGINIIPGTWAIILSAIVTVFGVVVGLYPLVLPPQVPEPIPTLQSEPCAFENVVQVPNASKNTQEVTAAGDSEITEPEQNIEGGGGANRQAISADSNSQIFRAKQNIKLT